MASTSDDDAEGLMNTTRPPPPTPGSPEPSPPPPPVPTPPEPSPPPASLGEPSTEASSGSALDRYYASDRYIASTAHYHASIQFGVVPYPPLEEQPTLAVQMLVSLSSVSAMLFLSLLTWHALRKRPSRRTGPIASAAPVLEVLGSVPDVGDPAWDEGPRVQDDDESQPMLGPAAPRDGGGGAGGSAAAVVGVRLVREPTS